MPRRLHLINNGSRDVLHGRLRVSGHELFAVDKNLLYLFAVDRDLSIIVDLCTGQSLDELLDGGAFGGAVSAGVVDEGVFFQYDLLRLCRHRSFFEHDGVSGKENGAELHIGILLDGYRPCEGLVADAGDLQDELSVGRSFDRELTVIARGGSRDEGGVAFQQLHRGKSDTASFEFLSVIVPDISRLCAMARTVVSTMRASVNNLFIVFSYL